jgi:hypothetical protein
MAPGTVSCTSVPTPSLLQKASCAQFAEPARASPIYPNVSGSSAALKNLWVDPCHHPEYALEADPDHNGSPLRCGWQTRAESISEIRVAPAYMGRKWVFLMFSRNARGCWPQRSRSCPHSRGVGGAAPVFLSPCTLRGPGFPVGGSIQDCVCGFR